MDRKVFLCNSFFRIKSKRRVYETDSYEQTDRKKAEKVGFPNLLSYHDDAGNDIVLAGAVGLEGSIRILKEKEEELRERFIPAFLDGLARKKKEL